jgi:hypothetical protein
MRSARRVRSLPVLAVGLVLLAGCGWLPGRSGPSKSSSPEEGVAAAIKAAPNPGWILDVEYEEGDYMDPPVVRIIVRPGTPTSDMDRLSCELIVDILEGKQLDPDLTIQYWDDDDYTRSYRDAACSE